MGQGLELPEPWALNFLEQGMRVGVQDKGELLLSGCTCFISLCHGLILGLPEDPLLREIAPPSSF